MSPPRPYVTVWNGLRVPWVTKWSGEFVPAQRVGVRLGDTPEVVVTPGGAAARDPSGAMWFLDGHGRGGEPLWSTVHTARQRRAMLRPCCQVCGIPLPRTGIPWLLSTAEWAALNEIGFTTATAPTCLPCQGAAARLCPHLAAQPTVSVTVGHATPWGVVGDRYARDGEITAHSTHAPFTRQDEIRMMLAKQLVVTLHDATPRKDTT